MKKQTVEQRFLAQEIIKGKTVPQHVAAEVLHSPQQLETQKILQSIKHALQQAEQTVQQIKTAEGVSSPLMMTEQQLLFAQQQLQQLETSAASMSNDIQQHITQLQLQIGTASGTLGIIQQALSSKQL